MNRGLGRGSVTGLDSGIWEKGLIKENISRNVDPFGDKFKTFVPLMGGVVT